jgi:DNA topoisomerase-6 subunit B
MRIDTTKNEPIILEEKKMNDGFAEHGIRIELEIEGKYIQRYHSIDEYLKETAIVNPYAKITYHAPDGRKTEYPRVIHQLPKQPRPIKPHPYGVEMGRLERMSKLTESRTVSGFLTNEFCRIGPDTAVKILKMAGIKPNLGPKNLDHKQLEGLWRTMQSFPFMKPPMDCLSPIGESSLTEGLKKEYKVEYITAVTRPAAVYRGNPFQIEVCMGYGGEMPQNEPAKLLRFANRVPLLYQGSSCAITKAIQKVDWRHYNIDQAGNMPNGTLIVAVHMASVWIPYTSESKEAIDPYPEIIKEMKLAIQDCARKMQRYISGRRREHEAQQRQNLFLKYIPEIADTLAKLSGEPKQRIMSGLEKMLKKGKIEGEDVEGEPEGTNKGEAETTGQEAG